MSNVTVRAMRGAGEVLKLWCTIIMADIICICTFLFLSRSRLDLHAPGV